MTTAEAAEELMRAVRELDGAPESPRRAALLRAARLLSALAAEEAEHRRRAEFVRQWVADMCARR